MRNNGILLFIIIFSLNSSIFGQFSNHKSNPYSKTIILSIHGGLSHSETDYANSEISSHVAGIAEYFFTTDSEIFFGLKLEAGYSHLLGSKGSGPQLQEFESNVLSFGPSVNVNYNFNKTLFPYVGLGIRNLWYKDFTSIDFVPEFGVRYLISKYFAINGNIAFNFVAEDNLDALVRKGSNNDFYSTISVGISYAVDLKVASDIDKDGIINGDDNCPEQAEDFDGFEDSDGCPEFDNDGDGIIDLKDKCPNEPEDFDGFEDADGCPELDNDGDGILDTEDNCPEMKEDFDGFNDSDGCPELDNDNDGILDEHDKCPNEHETFNNFEDFDGCPDEIPVTEIIEEKPIIIEEPKEEIIPENNIRVAIPNEFLLEGDDIFESNTAQLKKEVHKRLNEIAYQMKNNSGFRWRIEGHLDNSGSTFELKALSTARASAIMNYLISKGISPKSFQAVGLADDFPLAPNSTIQGRLKNRRVVIKRIR